MSEFVFVAARGAAIACAVEDAGTDGVGACGGADEVELDTAEANSAALRDRGRQRDQRLAFASQKKNERPDSLAASFAS
jgi:hypothetical protein